MCALRQARILSSETDNTIKQEQQTSVNINIKPSNKPRPQTVPLYPNVQPLNPNVNFTQVNQPSDISPGDLRSATYGLGQTLYIPTTTDSNYQSQPQTSNNSPLILDKGIADIGNEIEDLEKKNQFLQMLVEMYEGNPLKINSYVVCDSKLLMNMIKLLTDCDKVELVIDDSDVGCGCSASSSKFIKVAKILITKDGKTSELKYDYNEVYSQFVKYGISLKMVHC